MARAWWVRRLAAFSALSCWRVRVSQARTVRSGTPRAAAMAGERWPWQWRAKARSRGGITGVCNAEDAEEREDAEEEDGVCNAEDAEETEDAEAEVGLRVGMGGS